MLYPVRVLVEELGPATRNGSTYAYTACFDSETGHIGHRYQIVCSTPLTLIGKDHTEFVIISNKHFSWLRLVVETSKPNDIPLVWSESDPIPTDLPSFILDEWMMIGELPKPVEEELRSSKLSSNAVTLLWYYPFGFCSVMSKQGHKQARGSISDALLMFSMMLNYFHREIYIVYLEKCPDVTVKMFGVARPGWYKIIKDDPSLFYSLEKCAWGRTFGQLNAALGRTGGRKDSPVFRAVAKRLGITEFKLSAEFWGATTNNGASSPEIYGESFELSRMIPTPVHHNQDPGNGSLIERGLIANIFQGDDGTGSRTQQEVITNLGMVNNPPSPLEMSPLTAAFHSASHGHGDLPALPTLPPSTGPPSCHAGSQPPRERVVFSQQEQQQIPHRAQCQQVQAAPAVEYPVRLPHVISVADARALRGPAFPTLPPSTSPPSCHAGSQPPRERVVFSQQEQKQIPHRAQYQQVQAAPAVEYPVPFVSPNQQQQLPLQTVQVATVDGLQVLQQPQHSTPPAIHMEAEARGCPPGPAFSPPSPRGSAVTVHIPGHDGLGLQPQRVRYASATASAEHHQDHAVVAPIQRQQLQMVHVPSSARMVGQQHQHCHQEQQELRGHSAEYHHDHVVSTVQRQQLPTRQMVHFSSSAQVVGQQHRHYHQEHQEQRGHQYQGRSLPQQQFRYI